MLPSSSPRATPPPATPDPLSHLLVPEASEPWYVSLKDNLLWLVHRKEPPLEVTSKPVPVPEMWGAYRYGRISGPLSLAVHLAVIALLLFAGRFAVQHVNEMVYGHDVLVDPGVYIPEQPNQSHGGGGGGDRSPLPASKGAPPRFELTQLTPPQVINRNPNPRLTAEETVLGPPSLELPFRGQMGDPLGALGALSQGKGSGGGIGDGSGTGVGRGHGGGVGEGEYAGFGGKFYSPGGGVTRPQIVFMVEPEFSEEARKAKFQGTVVISAIVGVDGRAHALHVTRSLGLGLDQKAIDAVRQWKFKPGTKDGNPVPVAASIEVLFRLL